MSPQPPRAADVTIRAMEQRDLDDADRVHRLAFGTYYGLQDPSQFKGDAQIVRARWATDPSAAFVAEHNSRVIASILGMDWGSVFVIGPLTVHPEFAGRGIARLLMTPLMQLVETRKVKMAVLFTMPNSPTHIRLYESYGFAPQLLTPVMSKPAMTSAANSGILYSTLSQSQQAAALDGCRAISGATFDGLNLSREIHAINTHHLGDTVLLYNGDVISGFALCHFGPGTEADSGSLFIKFASVRPGAAEDFDHLLERCEALATAIGAKRIIGGVNTGRSAAYQLMQKRGYRADLIGVAMHRPSQAGYNCPNIFAIEDCR